jgi:tetratricopeptide (TPR) repeat protein
VIGFLLIALLVGPGAMAQGQSTPAQSVAARIQHSATLVQENKLLEAEQQIRLILKTNPSQPDALNLLGTIRARQGKLDEAETEFRRALKADPLLVGAHMNLALLYLLQHKLQQTISELQEVTRLDPKNLEAIYRLSRMQLEGGHPDDCIQLIEKTRTLVQPAPAYLLAILGDAYSAKGAIDKAEDIYLLALTQQSDSEDAILGLARAAHAKGSSGTESAYLSRARELAGGSAEGLYKFGVAAFRLKAYDEASQALDQAIKLNGDDERFFIARGAIWLEKPDIFEAERNFRRALELQPNDPQGQMYLGYTLLNEKKYPEARNYLEKSIKGDPSIPEPYYYMGLISQEENADDAAIEFFHKAVQISPSMGLAHLALGSSLLKLKNYPRAQEELEIAVKLSPNETKVHYQLALLYARLKDPKRAAEEMSIVQKLEGAANQGTKQGGATAPPSPSPR